MKHNKISDIFILVAFLQFYLIGCQKKEEPLLTLPTAVVTTIAGGEVGLVDGLGSQAKFNEPQSLALASDGSLYVADRQNGKIRKITNDGLVSTLEGSFEGINCLAVAADGTIYVGSDYQIHKISPTNQISVLVDGFSQTIHFNDILSIDFLPDGNLIVIDHSNSRVLKVTLDGEISHYAGGGLGDNTNSGYRDGSATYAQFNDPSDICVAIDGTTYVTDRYNYKVRKISPNGTVSTVAGSGYGYYDGKADIAKFFEPSGIAVAPDGTLYVADQLNNAIRKITPSGEVSTIAGGVFRGYADGNERAAKFQLPSDIVLAPDGSLFVTDMGNHRIRKIAFK